jgi:3-hydroxyisobutyrate dehydrogenase-like beta-hydroxyacid dehydrogenase
MNVALIGAGRMGSGIARNLLRAGHNVVVYNRSRARADALAAEGARIGESPAEAARECDAALTMLADDDATEHAVWGENGIATGLKQGAVHICSATISTALARRLSHAHAERGQHYLSAPVFGRPEAAEAKNLVVVTAGSPPAIDRCRPLFDAIGRLTFVAGGEPWQANAVKLCGNFMIASMLETFSEAFATLRKSGVTPHRFLDVMNALFASPVYANYGRLLADERFEPAGFALKLGLKDVRLTLQAAEEVASPMPFAAVIRDHLLEGIAMGMAESDWSVIAKVAARHAGLE